MDPGQMANSTKYESRLFLLTDGGSVAGDPVRARLREERNKERVERQKLLVSLPRSKPEQSMFSLVSERVAELREMQEDVLLLLAAEDLNAQKAIWCSI